MDGHNNRKHMSMSSEAEKVFNKVKVFNKIHDKNYEETRNRKNITSHNRGYMHQLLVNTILNTEKLREFLIKCRMKEE